MLTVSVVIPTAGERREEVRAAIASVQNQTYAPAEVVVVVDGQADFAGALRQVFDGTIVSHDQRRGVSAARNSGVIAAHGDIIAFLDDDATAAPDWLEQLVRRHDEGVLAVVGTVKTSLSEWQLPRELGWLVGISHNGAEESWVRNGIGSNMSFRREVFDRIGLFDDAFGLGGKGGFWCQGEEAEFGARMMRRLGVGMLHVPEATVYHTVQGDRMQVPMLLRRAYWQGRTKGTLMRLYGRTSLATETRYLQDLLSVIWWRYLLHHGVTALAWFASCLLAVGLGFVIGWGVRGCPRQERLKNWPK